MTIYTNITSAGTTTLIPKGSAISSSRFSNSISTITISNKSASNEATVSLQFWDGTSVGYNIIGNMKIPAGVTLVLNDNLGFDSQEFNLRVEVSGTSPTLDIIIK